MLCVTGSPQTRMAVHSNPALFHGKRQHFDAVDNAHQRRHTEIWHPEVVEENLNTHARAQTDRQKISAATLVQVIAV